MKTADRTAFRPLIRKRFLRTSARWLALVLLWSTMSPALAAPGELMVLGAAHVKLALTPIIEQYGRDTGQEVSTKFGPPTRLASLFKGAIHPDLVVASREEMQALEQLGALAPGSRVALGRMGMGVAVRQDATFMDTSTPEALRKSLAAAGSLIHADPADDRSGAFVADLLKRIGGQESLRVGLATGSQALAPVARGEVNVGIYPVDEILAAKGVKLAGLLPAALQRWTCYEIALSADTPNKNEAATLVRFLVGEQARPAFAVRGLASTTDNPSMCPS